MKIEQRIFIHQPKSRTMKVIKNFQINYIKAFFYAMLLCFLLSVNFALGQTMIIDLVEFKATPTEAGGITLTWTVEKLDPNNLYTIERTGEDGISAQIGIVQGITTFTDNAPLEGESKYQICLANYTSKICFNTLLVTYYKSRELSLSPNPTSNVLQVHYKVEKDADVQVQLFDQFGNLLEKHTPNTSAGGHRHISLDVNTYQNGFYFIRLIDGKAVETKQFYKQ